MNKGLFAALSLAVLLCAPACCFKWRKRCNRPKDNCVEERVVEKTCEKKPVYEKECVETIERRYRLPDDSCDMNNGNGHDKKGRSHHGKRGKRMKN